MNVTGADLIKKGDEETVTLYGTGIIRWDEVAKCIKETVFWSNGSAYCALPARKRHPKCGARQSTWSGEAKGVLYGEEYTEKVTIERKGQTPTSELPLRRYGFRWTLWLPAE